MVFAQAVLSAHKCKKQEDEQPKSTIGTDGKSFTTECCALANNHISQRSEHARRQAWNRTDGSPLVPFCGVLDMVLEQCPEQLKEQAKEQE